jgi:hypothetical protein
MSILRTSVRVSIRAEHYDLLCAQMRKIAKENSRILPEIFSKRRKGAMKTTNSQIASLSIKNIKVLCSIYIVYGRNIWNRVNQKIIIIKNK